MPVKNGMHVPPETLARLRAYGALDHPVRLQAYVLIQRSPGLPFRALAEAAGLESGLVAYHIGVLKAAGLVDVRYERTGMETSHYTLSNLGNELFDELFAERPPVLRSVRRPKSGTRGGSRAKA